MKETRRVLAEDIAEGLFTKGAQVSVTRGGDAPVDLALGDDGMGREMTSTTVFRVYCTIKPITAVAVALHVDAGRLDLDQPMSDHLPTVEAVADGTVTLRHVLNHTAGLHRPLALDLELIDPARRPAFLASTAARPGVGGRTPGGLQRGVRVVPPRPRARDRQRSGAGGAPS